MRFEDCFRLLAERLKNDIVVTSAGNCSELWWEITGETERVFYLEASMSLASLFAAGIALGAPQRTVVALSGDGAFCMNPGMLLVERQLALPNLKHFMVSNRVYGSTSNVPLPGRATNDYAVIARGFGVGRVYSFASLNELKGRFDEAAMSPGHSFIHLEVEPVAERSHSPPMDGPEVKFRFGRHVERVSGRRVFDAPLARPDRKG